MKKIYSLLIAVIMLGAATAQAQCPAGRYNSYVFPTINMSTVTYSTVYNLQMDIYQPTGDTLTARPLIILAHGGSFFSGTKSDDATVDSLCVHFAKRGYVTVSIDYRLTATANMFNADSAISEVVKAISDGKAAMRYFVKDRATTNTYKIDTNNIFIGGNSAGAVLYMHVGYLDSLGECPSYINAAMAINGGFEGNSGNAGYTTRSKAIVNLAGGVNLTSFVGPGDKPSVNLQGSNDDVVPYNCGYPLGGFTPVNLCGLGALEPVYVSNSINHMSHVFTGDGHVPWASDAAKFYTVDSLVTIFLYNLVCSDASGVTTINTNKTCSLYPNPAHDAVTIVSPEAISDVTMYDQVGRTIAEVKGINGDRYEMNTSGIGKGIYFMRVRFTDENSAPLVKRLVIE